MERFFIIVVIVGLVLGGYNCNRSTEQTSEKITIEALEPTYDPMEKEIMEEEEWIEKQTNSLKEWGNTEQDIPEEDLSD